MSAIIPDYGHQEPPTRIRYGFASMVFGVVFALPFILYQFVQLLDTAQWPIWDGLLGGLLGVLGLLAIATAPLGFAFGIAGRKMKGPHYRWALPGLVLNGIVFSVILYRAAWFI